MKRINIGFNVLVQIAVFAAIIGMINYLNFRHFKRWDFSRNQKFALAPLTKNLLSGLKKPVKAIVFFPSAQAIAQDVASLLREYEYASGRSLSVEVVDPYRNLLRAKELSEKYKFGNNDNIVILDYEGRSKFVNAVDMAVMENSATVIGQSPVVRGFKGEEALTSALLEITEEKQNKIYFLAGHGEAAITGQNSTEFKAFIERQNIRIETLNLNNVDTVPADASALVVLGPHSDLSERELTLLSDYWNERKGRIFLFLGGAAKAPRLVNWLATQGITPQQDVIVRTASMLVLENGQPAVRPSTVSTAVGVVLQSGKSILKDIELGIDLELAGLSQSIALTSPKSTLEKIRAFPLLLCPTNFWGETEYVHMDSKPAVNDPDKDHNGPLTVAVAIEKGGIEDPRVKVETSRLVLVGNSEFVSNEGIRISQSGLDFAINSLNWLINREQLAGIPPKPKQAVQLSLNEQQMSRLALVVMGLIPGLVAVFGAIVCWKRRH